MSAFTELDQRLIDALREHHGDHLGEYTFPPPVFLAMQGKFLDFDLEQGVLSVRFPVLESWLNPYGIMQGGMVAAAIDNTIGPLSALVASANVTRHFELKYSRAATPEMEFITVTAMLVERDDRWLTFKAEVRDPDEQRLVRAKAIHWIL